MLAPRPYQIVGRDFLASRTRALLADEMRVGKTPQAILAAEAIGAGHVLVLCPAIAVPHWHREWGKWAPASYIEVDVMSYDGARNRWEAGHFDALHYDVLIVDEAHFAKNPEAKRTQMVYGKNGIGHKADRLWALSGTPATKHAGELWPLLRAFGATDLSYEAFLTKYCTGYYDARTRKFRVTGTQVDKTNEVRHMLAPYMLRRTRREVAPEMPGIGFNFLEVYPERFADIQNPFGVKWPDSEAFERWIDANAANDTTNRQAVAEAQVPALVQEIEGAIAGSLYHRTVVFGWHKEPLQRLAWSLNQRGITAGVLNGDTSPKRRELIQDKFWNGSLDVVCANILAAGTAIDLSLASHGYFLELDWLPANNLQAANRLVSMQKQEPVTIDVVTTPGTINARLQRVLVRRVNELNQLM